MTPTQTVKTCRKCLETKRFSEFHRRSVSQDGLHFACRACVRKLNASPGNRASRKAYLQTRSGKRSKRLCAQNYRASEGGKRVFARAARKYHKKAAPRLSRLLRARVYRAAKRGRAGSAVRDLGCSVAELRAHLEQMWRPGMSWENHGSGPGTWQIDHIRPLAGFDLTQRDQLLQACHYSNLQPLWFKDHVRKTAAEQKAFTRSKNSGKVSLPPLTAEGKTDDADAGDDAGTEED